MIPKERKKEKNECHLRQLSKEYKTLFSCVCFSHCSYRNAHIRPGCQRVFFISSSSKTMPKTSRGHVGIIVAGRDERQSMIS